jgi:hypothetical protein
MSVPVLPSLSAWVEAPMAQLRLLFVNCLLSEYSQTTVYSGQITSIPYILSTNKNNINNLINDLEVKLREYFLRYFDGCTVNIQSAEKTDRKYILYLDISVTRKGITYSLLKALHVEDSVVKQTLDYFN